MKQVLVVAVLLGVAARDSLAQGVDVHNRLGESGSHFTLPLGTEIFAYETLIAGATAPFQVTLEVYHNGVLSFADKRDAPGSTIPFAFVSIVPLGSLRLSAGDTVTFVLRVTDSATGETLATHCLFGDVAGP